ncbi:putative transposon, En/Spm-like protein, partial [Tanacetum coccineum]
NRNKPEGCIAEETIAEETIEFFSEYHKSMETIGIPPDKHETDENKEGNPLSAGKSGEVSAELFQKTHLYVIHNTDEIVSYIERHKQVLKTENPSKRIAFLENEHSKSFAKWLCKEVERELVYQNSGVSVEAIDLHISKEVGTTRQAFYYEVLQEIWVLDYRFRQIPLFKCDWVNHRAGGVKRDNIGYTLVDLNNLGHKVDPFILASQVRQVFYVKDQIDKKNSIVFKTPPKNYKDTYDEVNEEFSIVIHHRNDNILPCVNRRDLGNESRDDYYRTDCRGVVIRKSK